MTRNQAIKIANTIVQCCAPTTGHKHARRAYERGVRDALLAFAAAGAFEDGKNMADRVGGLSADDAAATAAGVLAGDDEP